MIDRIKRRIRRWLGIQTLGDVRLELDDLDMPRRPYDEVTAFVRGDPGPRDEQPEPADPPRSSIIVELGPWEVPVFGVRTLGTWEGRGS